MRKTLRRSALFLLCAVPILLWFFFHPKYARRQADRSADTPPAEGVELVQNGGFEEPGAPVPRGWNREMRETGDKGMVSTDSADFHSGKASLKLEPNGRNGGDHPLAVSQLIPAGDYRGRTLNVSAYLKTEGGADAVLAILSLVRGKPTNLAGDAQRSGSSGWSLHRKEYAVPNDPSVQLVVVCSANGRSGVARFDDVSVMFGDAPAEATGAAAGVPLQASVSVDTSHVIRQIPRTLFGANIEWVWNGNFLWLDRDRKPDPDLLRLTSEMGVMLFRYPGGYYSDFYHWRDGVGPIEKRPETVHDGTQRERSRANFGTEELLQFAKEAGGEVLLTVNAGTGTAREAAEWVRYVNGNGLRVRDWEVGNEIYINDGSPLSKTTTMDPAKYAAHFREFAQAMKAADPRIRVGAIGGENRGSYAFVQYRDWDKIVLQRAGDLIDFFAVHNAYAPVNISDRDDLRTVYRGMLAAPVLIARNLDAVARQIAEYVPAKAGSIPIAVTEWGPLFQVDPKGAYSQHNKTLGSALFAASTLKTLIESPRTETANFHVLNDLGIMGWIGSLDGSFPPHPHWAPTARSYAFQIFSRHFGPQLVKAAIDSPTYDARPIGTVETVKGVPLLDVTASLSQDGRELYLIAINKSLDNPIDTSIRMQGFVPRTAATAWTLNGTGIDANTGTKALQAPGLTWGKQREDATNPRFDKGGPGEVTFSQKKVADVRPDFHYRFPAHSVTSLVLTRR